MYKRQKEHRPILYNHLLMSEKLYPHLIEIDRTAQERVDTMLPHMMETAGVTEELKACDPMRWVGLMNTLTAQIEEILIRELDVYKRQIWILDDPEGFEQAYGALSEKLGAEWQTKLIPWRSQPALSGLELGSYNTAADGSQTVDIQSRFAGYSVAVFDASDALWQALNS